MPNTEEMNIYQKLAKIRKRVEVMKRSKQAYGYSYTAVEDILAKVTIDMERYGLSLLPTIVPGTMKVEPYSYSETKTLKNGEPYEKKTNEVLVSADTKWTWVNNDNPTEHIEIPWALVGQQTDASQSFGSGLSYSFRYFLIDYFNIATSDNDPDELRSKQKKAEEESERAVLHGILEEIDAHMKLYMASHPDDGDKVKKVISKYVKDSNYFKIKESALAAKLLEDVRKSFPVTAKGAA